MSFKSAESLKHSKFDMLAFLSGDHHSVVQSLESGFTVGFPLHYEGPGCSHEAPNMLSATLSPDAVDAKISKELDAHRLAGPFSTRTPPLSCVSGIASGFSAKES